MSHPGFKSQRILDFIKENPGSTVADVMTVFPADASPAAVSGLVRYLRSKKLLENRGTSGRGARWYLVGASETSHWVIAGDLLSELGTLSSNSNKQKYLAKRLEEIFS